MEVNWHGLRDRRLALQSIAGLYRNPENFVPPGIELVPMKGFKLEDASFEPNALRVPRQATRPVLIKFGTVSRSFSFSPQQQWDAAQVGAATGQPAMEKKRAATANVKKALSTHGTPTGSSALSLVPKVSCDSGRQDLFTHAEYITDTNARYDAKTRGLRRGDRMPDWAGECRRHVETSGDVIGKNHKEIAFDVEEPQGSKKSMQAVNVEILDLVKRSRSPSRRRSRSRGRGGGGRGRSRSRGRNTRAMEQDSSGPQKDGAKPRGARDDSRKPTKRRDSRRRSPPPRRRSDSRSNSRRNRRSP
eukprot:s728_g23.t1